MFKDAFGLIRGENSYKYVARKTISFIQKQAGQMKTLLQLGIMWQFWRCLVAHWGRKEYWVGSARSAQNEKENFVAENLCDFRKLKMKFFPNIKQNGQKFVFHWYFLITVKFSPSLKMHGFLLLRVLLGFPTFSK